MRSLLALAALALLPGLASAQVTTEPASPAGPEHTCPCKQKMAGGEGHAPASEAEAPDAEAVLEALTSGEAVEGMKCPMHADEDGPGDASAEEPGAHEGHGSPAAEEGHAAAGEDPEAEDHACCCKGRMGGKAGTGGHEGHGGAGG